MLRATRSRFEEDRLDEQCARAHKRGKAPRALDEAGSCTNAGGARVPAQVQRKDVHLFFGRIRGGTSASALLLSALRLCTLAAVLVMMRRHHQ
jgi:hypothetical protein